MLREVPIGFVSCAIIWMLLAYEMGDGQNHIDKAAMSRQRIASRIDN